MAKFLSGKHFSIRNKVILGLALSTIAFVGVGIIAYRHLSTIERKMEFVFKGHELHDTLLEARSYEKNFLLYGEGRTLMKRLPTWKGERRSICAYTPPWRA